MVQARWKAFPRGVWRGDHVLVTHKLFDRSTPRRAGFVDVRRLGIFPSPAVWDAA